MPKEGNILPHLFGWRIVVGGMAVVDGGRAFRSRSLGAPCPWNCEGASTVINKNHA
jgi:hypothetical protein